MTNNSTSLAHLFDGKSDRCGCNQAEVHRVALLLVTGCVGVIFCVCIAILCISVVSLVRIGVVLYIGVRIVCVAVGVISIAVGIISIAVRLTINRVGVTTVAGVAVSVIGV